jgi:hypothetical protein
MKVDWSVKTKENPRTPLFLTKYELKIPSSSSGVKALTATVSKAKIKTAEAFILTSVRDLENLTHG